MKIEELLLEAFNWYYEEGIWNINISNEEALELFKETETYQDFYNKANGAEQSESTCNLQNVNGRLPNAEDVKRWFQLLVGKSEIEMQKDIEATLR